MQSKKFIIHQARDWQSIETFHKEIIDFLVVLVKALRSEIKELSHLSTFVVAP